ncbi:MAG: signal recognition particle receptor subunit alpha [Arcobacter sp.]|nr:signal recognition particle receptor subunit alpha [Arcobacter sp.]
MFDLLTSSFKSVIGKIRYQDDGKALSNAIAELKKSFLKYDVHHKTTKELLERIELKTKQKGIGQDNFLKALRESLSEVLVVKGNQGFVYNATSPLTTILMTGLQGSGKTTTTGKLANYLKQRNKKVLIAAADLQRLAAVEQLKQIGAQIDVDVFFDDNETDPVKIVQKAKQKAIDGLYDVLLVDTAGRLAIDEELMTQLKNIKVAINPTEIFYVADSMTGHDATKTAITFQEKIGIDGVILTKFDGDTKGGVALSLSHQTKVPFNSVELKRIKALIGSMTPKERENPDLLNISRKKRIVKGSGLGEVQVNKILKQFHNASKMAKKMSSKGGMKDMQRMMAQMNSSQAQIPR